jgi:hemerythrin
MIPPLSQWSSKMEVGIPRIDAQHKQLFDLAATFGDKGDEIRVMKTILQLCDYVKVHLREEEVMMERWGFPGIEAHRQEHKKFKGMLVELLGNAKTMTLDQIADEVHRLINGWFYNHILTVDFEYKPYVKTGDP